MKITSTTDSPEAVTAALGDLAENEEVENTSAPAPKERGEKREASETSEQAEDEEVEAASDEDEAEEESKTDEDERPRRRPGFKRKIDKLNRRISEREQLLTAREREIELLREQLKTGKPEKEKSGVAATDGKPVKPNPDDFESHADYEKAQDKYVEDLVDWKADQKLKAKELDAKKEKLKSEEQSLLEAHMGRIATFKKDHADFEEVIEEAEDVPLSITVRDCILNSEDSAALMYELAKDPEELERICELPALQAARAIGRIEARLQKESSAKETPEPKVTKAPKPLSPIGSGSAKTGKRSIFDEKLSQKEYERMMEEREARRSA
jgi:phosphoglycolate phosphatase-like HAD superfamily hydrolase